MALLQSCCADCTFKQADLSGAQYKSQHVPFLCSAHCPGHTHHELPIWCQRLCSHYRRERERSTGDLVHLSSVINCIVLAPCPLTNHNLSLTDFFQRLFLLPDRCAPPTPLVILHRWQETCALQFSSLPNGLTSGSRWQTLPCWRPRAASGVCLNPPHPTLLLTPRRSLCKWAPFQVAWAAPPAMLCHPATRAFIRPLGYHELVCDLLSAPPPQLRNLEPYVPRAGSHTHTFDVPQHCLGFFSATSQTLETASVFAWSGHEAGTLAVCTPPPCI